ncbi:hypothetical protein L210DRAFT_947623, partial [Boletus edulis BED1]
LLQEGQPFFSKVQRRATKRTNSTRLITVVNLLGDRPVDVPQLQGGQDIKKPQAAFRRYPPRIPNPPNDPQATSQISADASVNNDGSLRYWYRMGTGTGRFLSPTVDV